MKEIWNIVAPSIPETLYMVFVSTAIALIVGLPTAVLLYISRKDGLAENPTVYRIFDGIINILRSLPAVIVILLVAPFSRFIVGKAIGSTAAIVPLSVAAAPFVARLMEGYFLEIDKGLIESARAMGSTTAQIITKVLIPESIPTIINGVTMTIINLIGYSALAGMLGGGGLGDIAIRYGYQRYRLDVLWFAVIIIIIIVQIVQFTGNTLSKKTNKK